MGIATSRDLNRAVGPILRSDGFTSKGSLYQRRTAFGEASIGFAKSHVPEAAGVGEYTFACEITYGYMSNAQRDYLIDRSGGAGLGRFSMLRTLFFFGLLVPRSQFPGWTRREFPYRWPLEFEPYEKLWASLNDHLEKVLADVASWDSPAVVRDILTLNKGPRHAYLYPVGPAVELWLALGLVDAGGRQAVENLLPALTSDQRQWVENRLDSHGSAG